jgi:hypothetical protein
VKFYFIRCNKGCPSLFSPRAAHTVEPFRETAFFHESLFLRGNLAVGLTAPIVRCRRRNLAVVML